jgi:hypothetical protein
MPHKIAPARLYTHRKPRLLTTAILALLVLASAPGAGARALTTPALTLAWSDCLESGGGATTVAFGCAANTVTFTLQPAFTLAAAVDSVVAIEGVVDVLSQSGTLPSWWELQPGGCRGSALVALEPVGSGCSDPWAGNGVSAIQAYRVSPETSAPDRARIVFTASVLPSQKVALQPGIPYTGPALALGTQTTVGTNACSGCSATACLVFNSVTLKRVPGATGADIVISDPASTANWAYWQGTTGLDCAVVPVRNRTWGAIKSLYR